MLTKAGNAYRRSQVPVGVRSNLQGGAAARWRAALKRAAQSSGTCQDEPCGWFEAKLRCSYSRVRSLLALSTMLLLATVLALPAPFASVHAEEAATPAELSPEKLAFELRIVWGGGKPRAFQGSISIDDGTLSVVRNLSLQADSIESISNANSSTIKLSPNSLSTFGGVDVDISGSLSSKLTLRFDDANARSPIEHILPLSEILHGNWIRPLDDQGSRIAAERQMQDRIRVQSSQPAGIFATGAPYQATVSGYHCNLPAGDYQLSTNVVDEDSGASVSKIEDKLVAVDNQGNFPATLIDMSLPSIEGAYAIELSLNRKRFLPSLVNTGAALKRRIDFVTFDYHGNASRLSNWIPAAKIQPLGTQWWTTMNWISSLGATQSLTQFAGMADHTKLPVSHGGQKSRSLAGMDYLTLSPDAWQAYPLRIAQAGQPHRLRVKVPTDQPQQLVISIRDFHNNGEPTTLNVDSGVVLSERQVLTENFAKTGFIEHEIVFWPRSEQPYVLMLNASTVNDAAFGEISLEVGQLTPTTAATLAPPAELELPQFRLPAADFGDSRSSALYLSKPLLADAFGGQRSIDPITRRPLESWLTWHQSVKRLTQYMQSTGYNTLVFNAVSDGAAVFPSQFPATKRFDNGTFFSDGRSPELKDLIALICCHFDRAGLRLVLGMEVNSHLPGLAKWDGNPAKQSGHYQVHIDGTPWKPDTEVGSRRVLYNPLHPQVQAEIEQRFREISTRYAEHQCFSGIALDLGESSHLIFAGDRWGYDDATLRKFEAHTQSTLPPRESLADAMKGGMRLGFLNWRAAELSSFYARLAEAIGQSKAGAKLMINPLPIMERRPSERDCIDPSLQSRNLSDYWLAAGLDYNRLKQQANIILVRGRLESPLKSSIAQDWLSRITTDGGLANSDIGNSAGALLIQRPIGLPIVEAEKLNNSSTSSTAWCYPQISPLGSGALQGIVALLHREDALMIGDGGLMPIQGNTAKLQQLRQTYLALPNVPMHTLNIDSGESSIRIRSATVNNNTYLQLINAAPWPERVTMDVRIASSHGLVEILGGRQLQLNGNATQLTASSRNTALRLQRSTVWQFEVPPFDLIGVKVSDPQFQVNSVMHSPDPTVVAQITKNIEALEKLVAFASDPEHTNIVGISGGDFESWQDSSRPVGWTLSSLPHVSISRENSLPHSGKSCIVLENRNNAQVSAWIQSEKIGIPESGRLTVEAWVRSSPSANSPMLLHLSVIGRTRDGRRFHRSYQLASSPQANEVSVDWGRKPVVLHVNDVPSDELIELHVAFDLVGPGKIWVDDIQAYEPLINPEERVQIRGQLFLAREKLRENNPFPAEQVLNSNWAKHLSQLNQRLDSKSTDGATATTEAPQNSNTRWTSPAPIIQHWRESMRERWQK